MDTWFRTEAGCWDYVRGLRWPEGFVCRRCGAIGEPWVTAREVFHCRACAGETSLTAGTIFEGTRKPLRMWFLAMWFVTSQKNGVSASGLQRVLGLGSYTDGWNGYSGLAAAGYKHQVTVIKSGAEPAHEVMPRIHMVASLLKR